MRGTYITATIIAILIALWLFSGQVGREPPPEHPTLAEANQIRAAGSQDATAVRVRARVVNASPQTQELVLRGKTENKRSLVMKSETAGRIVARPVERGARVNAGDLLCRLADDDRGASLQEAQASLNQARIDYEGSLKLKERALLSDSSVAQARARVAAAEAEVIRRQLDVERAYVRAPFTAIVEDVYVEIGDYVTPGTSCVSLVDMDPMLLVGRVSERDIQDIEVGQAATGMLSDGRVVTGQLTFIGQQSDPATRTYAIEVEVPNADLALRSGITTRIRVPTTTVMAQKISPAVFSLDDEGNIGVRTVNERNQVEYHLIQILHDDVDGVWVTGLPEVATVITVGQELVVAGQTVQVSYEPSDSLPAAAPTRGPGSGTTPDRQDREQAAERDPAKTRDGAALTAGPRNVQALAAVATPQ
jgi:membrane fusion protein, multidrug efflux system